MGNLVGEGLGERLHQQAAEVLYRLWCQEAAIIHNLGRLKANSGQIEQAIALFQQSLDITEHIGNVQGKAATEQGDLDTALHYLQQSLEILQRIQSSYAETLRQIIARVQQMRDDIQ